jgi:hypothetical protein
MTGTETRRNAKKREQHTRIDSKGQSKERNEERGKAKQSKAKR